MLPTTLAELLREPFLRSMVSARTEIVGATPSRIDAHLLPLKVPPPPFVVPIVAIKQPWHRRAHADLADAWLRKVVTALFVRRDPTLERRLASVGSASADTRTVAHAP